MSEQSRPKRDAFTVSLGGMTTITSTVVAPAIAYDRLNKALDERQRRMQEEDPATARETAPLFGRFWWRALRRAT